ncbi:hypothetical protein MO767_22010 [Pseudomonas sp. UYIF39]|uniref:hypothetical protein n=1 Tax=Pseudomonas sp. UYIF39 TaxID=1630747 RepID=UPI00249DFD33|nr:hypothetical protein [Pseudomonas sp. UYIF39]MDI3357003.1 hypothetical protein [Pseudomonas sp. UYIF39]
MDKKTRGPAFQVGRLDLAQCPICKGATVVKGVFHELACIQCNASGWVAADTGEALPLEILVTQLGLLLQKVQRRVIALESGQIQGGPTHQYEQNNRRGAGGSNYTGD